MWGILRRVWLVVVSKERMGILWDKECADDGVIGTASAACHGEVSSMVPIQFMQRRTTCAPFL
jgi:hypothetical protein